MSIILGIIQERVQSTRLKNKWKLPLGNSNKVEQCIKRLKKASFVDDVILAIPNDKENEIIKDLYKDVVNIYQGSENDVLDRFYQATKDFSNVAHVVRITADCPLIDPGLIDSVIMKHLKENADYTSNAITETFPDGYDVAIMKYSTLEKAWKEATEKQDREHVITYILKNPDKFKLCELKSENNYFDYKLSIDRQEDYDLVKKIFDALYDKNNYFGLKEVIQFLEDNSELLKINANKARNEGYFADQLREKLNG